MKVLFTLDSLAYGGTEKSTLDIVKHFSDDVQVKVIYFYPGDDLKAAYESAGIPLEYAGLSGKRSFIAGTKALLKIIKKEKPDLIVSSIMRANFYSRFAARISGVPLVGTFVNDRYSPVRIQQFKSKKQLWSFRFFGWLDKITARIPVYWISNSIAIAHSNIAALKIQVGKTKVIYRGRDASLFKPWQERKQREVFRFAFLGRLLDSKGLEELMTAMKRVVTSDVNVKLDIYGDGTYRKNVEKLISENGLENFVEMHGKVPDGWKQLYQADCFVFPSRYEGFSGALVEAMMTGIPIIASDIPMNLEAVDEQTALIFPVMNAEVLASKMVEMKNNYAQYIAMGQTARKVSMERFEIRSVSAQYEQFLKEVVLNKVDKADLI